MKIQLSRALTILARAEALEVDRQIKDGRGLMVGILAAYEAARLMALSDEDLRAAYERSVR